MKHVVIKTRKVVLQCVCLCVKNPHGNIIYLDNWIDNWKNNWMDNWKNKWMEKSQFNY